MPKIVTAFQLAPGNACVAIADDGTVYITFNVSYEGWFIGPKIPMDHPPEEERSDASS